MSEKTGHVFQFALGSNSVRRIVGFLGFYGEHQKGVGI